MPGHRRRRDIVVQELAPLHQHQRVARKEEKDILERAHDLDCEGRDIITAYPSTIGCDE